MNELWLRILFVMGTVAAYLLSLKLEKRWKWAHPLVTATVVLLAVLYGLRIPYAEYERGGAYFGWLLGPATVALGVPMYKQGLRLKGALRRLLLVVMAGSMVGMATAGFVAWLLGAGQQVVLSTLAKSVTTPIAIQVTERLHGDARITVAMVLVTGLLGSMIGTPVLRLARILHDHAVGSAMGSAAHAVGTASLMRHSEEQGAVSSLAMAMAGVMTSVMAMLLSWCWR